MGIERQAEGHMHASAHKNGNRAELEEATARAGVEKGKKLKYFYLRFFAPQRVYLAATAATAVDKAFAERKLIRRKLMATR